MLTGASDMQRNWTNPNMINVTEIKFYFQDYVVLKQTSSEAPLILSRSLFKHPVLETDSACFVAFAYDIYLQYLPLSGTVRAAVSMHHCDRLCPLPWPNKWKKLAQFLVTSLF